MKMSRLCSLMLLTLIAGCTDHNIEREKVVVRELRKLSSYTATGLNYNQYTDRLLTVKAEVDADLKDIPDASFSARVSQIESRYMAARDAWESEMTADHPYKADVRKFWSDADVDLNRVEKFVGANVSRRKAMDDEDQRQEELARRAAELKFAAEVQQREIAQKLAEEDQVRRQAEREAEQKKQREMAEEAERKRIDAEAAVAAAEYHRRFAPVGTLYLLTQVSAHIKGGVASILPGAELTTLHKNPDGTLHVKEAHGRLETDIDPIQATNDRDLAARTKQIDEDGQQQAVNAAVVQQSAAQQRDLEQQIRAGAAMDAAADRSRSVGIGASYNPLNDPAQSSDPGQ